MLIAACALDCVTICFDALMVRWVMRTRRRLLELQRLEALRG